MQNHSSMTPVDNLSTADSILIEAQNINHRFADNLVLQNISLQILPKQIVTLIGPNGAGKSTLLKILLGLIKPSEGKIRRAENLRIGFMPQKIQVDPTLPMSVKRFLQLGLNRHHPTNHKAALAKGRKPLFKRLVERLFFRARYDNTLINKTIEELDIGHLLNQPIQKVSGGEMQRILLARALIRQPDLLVLDEPVQGVDLQGQTEIYQYINKIRHEYGCGILMVSHDLHIVMSHTDQVLCLNQHLCCTGHPQSVSQSPEFQALFGEMADEIAIYEHHHDHSQCQHTHGEHHQESANEEKLTLNNHKEVK
ncbi:ATP-binding cassette domain-containing protein [Thiomicrorhabdus sediminis]|nr:ATP-binding cassette domain-containing protein [Thiomicrorhabdus sediminis]